MLILSYANIEFLKQRHCNSYIQRTNWVKRNRGISPGRKLWYQNGRFESVRVLSSCSVWHKVTNCKLRISHLAKWPYSMVNKCLPVRDDRYIKRIVQFKWCITIKRFVLGPSNCWSLLKVKNDQINQRNLRIVVSSYLLRIVFSKSSTELIHLVIL